MVIDPDTLRQSKRRLRVLFVSEILGAGGAEKLAEISTRLLTRAGHKCWAWSIAPLSDGSLAGTDFGSTTICSGYLPNAVDLVKRENIQIVILNNTGGADCADLFRAAGAYCVIVPFGFTQYGINRLAALYGLEQNVAAVWGYESIAAAMLQKGFSYRSYKYLAPLDLSEFSLSKRAWGPPFELGFCGRFSAEKNINAVLEVYSLVRERIAAPMRLHMIGGTNTNSPANFREYWDAIRAQVCATPLYQQLLGRGELIDHGFIAEAPALIDVLRRVHVLMLTSDFEGEPVAFMEHMATGGVCAGRRVSEVGPLLDGCGILTDAVTERMTVAEKRQMADGIVALLTDEGRYRSMARASRKRVEHEHSPEVWVRRFDAVMTDVMVQR